MVDTIKCKTELDLTETIYEKLLLSAIDKCLDHTKMEAQHRAKDGQDTNPALPVRSKTTGKGKQRQWSDDETLVTSSSRWNSLHANRSSTMQPSHESPLDDTRSTPIPEKGLQTRPPLDMH